MAVTSAADADADDAGKAAKGAALLPFLGRSQSLVNIRLSLDATDGDAAETAAPVARNAAKRPVESASAAAAAAAPEAEVPSTPVAAARRTPAKRRDAKSKTYSLPRERQCAAAAESAHSSRSKSNERNTSGRRDANQLELFAAVQSQKAGAGRPGIVFRGTLFSVARVSLDIVRHQN